MSSIYKAFDRTVRDLKREVNKNVLKVPDAERKALDATTNEPWGPHGQLLVDLARASHNPIEYSMVMNVLWKRCQDVGKDWRHVYKALVVMDYLVAHGTDRVVRDLRDRSAFIQSLADFQYMDSAGKDQGLNVRTKTQSLLALLRDSARIAELRDRAAATRDRFKGASVAGSGRASNPYGDYEPEKQVKDSHPTASYGSNSYAGDSKSVYSTGSAERERERERVHSTDSAHSGEGERPSGYRGGKERYGAEEEVEHSSTGGDAARKSGHEGGGVAGSRVAGSGAGGEGVAAGQAGGGGGGGGSGTPQSAPRPAAVPSTAAASASPFEEE
ncbi:unnamed protein product, partial [Closterium sp. NIES-53]